MINEIKSKKEDYLNACVFVDYENLFEKLQEYQVNPISIKFFEVIKRILQEKYKLNIIDFVAYCNFEKNKIMALNSQTTLQACGIQTRHTSNNGKNSADLEITVDALKVLYKNPNIEVFVIISNDRDNIPLIKTIKGENKIAFVVSTENGFNKIVCEYADYHEFIEDIFSLDRDIPTKNYEKSIEIDESSISEEQIKNSKEVCSLFYNSNPYKKYKESAIPVGLNGYIASVKKKVLREYGDIYNEFLIGNHFKFIELYKGDNEKEVLIKDGENKKDLE